MHAEKNVIIVAVLVIGLLVGLVLINLPVYPRTATLCNELTGYIIPSGSTPNNQNAAVSAWYNEKLDRLSYAYGNATDGRYVWFSTGSNCSDVRVFTYLPIRGIISLFLIICTVIAIQIGTATITNRRSPTATTKA